MDIIVFSGIIKYLLNTITFSELIRLPAVYRGGLSSVLEISHVLWIFLMLEDIFICGGDDF